MFSRNISSTPRFSEVPRPISYPDREEDLEAKSDPSTNSRTFQITSPMITAAPLVTTPGLPIHAPSSWSNELDDHFSSSPDLSLRPRRAKTIKKKTATTNDNIPKSTATSKTASAGTTANSMSTISNTSLRGSPISSSEHLLSTSISPAIPVVPTNSPEDHSNDPNVHTRFPPTLVDDLNRQLAREGLVDTHPPAVPPNSTHHSPTESPAQRSPDSSRVSNEAARPPRPDELRRRLTGLQEQAEQGGKEEVRDSVDSGADKSPRKKRLSRLFSFGTKNTAANITAAKDLKDDKENTKPTKGIKSKSGKVKFFAKAGEHEAKDFVQESPKGTEYDYHNVRYNSDGADLIFPDRPSTLPYGMGVLPDAQSPDIQAPETTSRAEASAPARVQTMDSFATSRASTTVEDEGHLGSRTRDSLEGRGTRKASSRSSFKQKVKRMFTHNEDLSDEAVPSRPFKPRKTIIVRQDR
ncbi:hypothetical protein BT63DRAFT_478282 [Microthyrium microscopicum]|uniref:Uncharacterized protein n=1 Tax=Microthyrium microscopicum TaxID=703497 RepID=A0A6A6UCS8_9PEZI|nr:hypothetical protein BT63DRAFT_478282 [Microthyrium microscopicum]